MTTGSFNRDSFSVAIADFIGLKWSRNWNGIDRPKTTRPPYEYYYTYRDSVDAHGKVYAKRLRFRVPGPGVTAGLYARVPKRAYNEEHPYTMDETWLKSQLWQVKIPPGSPGGTGFNWPNPEPVGAVSQFVQPTWAPVNLLSTNDQIKLVGKLKDLLDGSDFNMGVFLGELGESLGMIGSTATTLALALSQARAGKFQDAAGTLVKGTGRKPQKGHKNGNLPKPADLASKWLELQYGWLPLIEDTKAAAYMLAHALNVPMRQSYRVAVRRESVTVGQGELGPSVGNRYFNKSIRTHRRSLIARIQEKGSIPQMLGLTDPQLIAWELVPYSFVADWFIPIGSWMEARALVNRLTGTFVTSDKMMGTALTPTCPYLITVIDASHFNRVVFTRSISTTLKVPMPRFKPLGQSASWQHCANAVALLVNGFAGGRPPHR